MTVRKDTKTGLWQVDISGGSTRSQVSVDVTQNETSKQGEKH